MTGQADTHPGGRVGCGSAAAEIVLTRPPAPSRGSEEALMKGTTRTGRGGGADNWAVVLNCEEAMARGTQSHVSRGAQG